MAITASQFSQLTLTILSVPQLGHPGVSDTIADLFADAEMMISRRGHKRLMSDAEHLTVTRQHPQQIRHRAADSTADSRVDFIKQQRAGSIDLGQTGLESQQKARHLSTRSNLGEGSHWLTGIG